MNTIQTFSGETFDFNNPELSVFSIRDIAHALANLCRFTGHVTEFYSVAQHSVLVSRAVPPEFALQALLHDAAEAFTGDVSSPLKALLPDFKRIEKMVEHEVFSRFGLPDELSVEVKKADQVLLRTEQRDLMSDGAKSTFSCYVKPLKENISPWFPSEAKRHFLMRFREVAYQSRIASTINLKGVSRY